MLATHNSMHTLVHGTCCYTSQVLSFSLQIGCHDNDKGNKGKKIWGLSINMTVIEKGDEHHQPVREQWTCQCLQQYLIYKKWQQETHLQELKAYIIKCWLHKKEDMAQDIQRYGPIRHELAMIDKMALKGKWIIIPSQLQMQILKEQLSNQMGIEKTRLLADKSVYWVKWMLI